MPHQNNFGFPRPVAKLSGNYCLHPCGTGSWFCYWVYGSEMIEATTVEPLLAAHLKFGLPYPFTAPEAWPTTISEIYFSTWGCLQMPLKFP